LVLCCLSGPAIPAEAEAGATQPSSTAGKYRLHYGVEWRMVRAGLARVTWTPEANGGVQADLHLESAGLVNKLYRVNDDYRANLTSELCGSTVLFNSEEGKRRRESKLTFDRAAGKVSYLERDLIKNNTVLSKELQIPQCTFEYMGAMHHLRNMRLEPGQSVTVPVTDGKKFAQVKVEAQEREQVKTPVGTFSAIRHEIHMFNGVIIPKNAKMYMWLTDDARRLPVQLRVRLQFLIGTITLQLEKEERL
jgi:hypothetical protein